MTFWILLFVLMLCRAVDLGTTFLVTPDLRWEVNPLIRRLGWFWTLVLNVAVCFEATHLYVCHGIRMFWGVFCALSVLAGIWNVWVKFER